ncbi:MAG: glycerol-3-phosphate 1-O-acyltransferase PlsY [Oscillospiraceae bacterium]|jgi:glycerol-3-phosphate acyltransferase PlsY|nr:glycerol-3-phosphate 1-O-acyltransferase PlsY [Oscillospiraceae bacterium]
MNEALGCVAAALCGYLLGSVNTALVISRLVFKKDIRREGSGNAGVTNAMRVMGLRAGAAVIVGDAAKAVAAVALGRALAGDAGGIVGGIAVLAGHAFPLFFGFRGGKGVMSAAGVMFMWDWKSALAAITLFGVVLLLTRYVSLGSLCAVTSLPLFAGLVFNRAPYLVITLACVAAGIIFLHKQNIVRLIKGTENRVSPRKRQKE